MKYSSTNKPLVCLQTQSTCYKGTTTMTPLGVLWHSTGANNPRLKRYVQPSDIKPVEDTYTKEKWLELLGKNTYKNDWNHIDRSAGLNCWIGQLADGTVTTVQTLPWDFRPWGCGKGAKGSCNNGFMQFEICEDNLANKDYFDKVYKEGCEVTAYYCKMYNIDPKGTTFINGVKVPTVLCHADSYKLGLGSNHGDIYHWFSKYNKTMDDVRNDVAKLLEDDAVQSAPAVVAYEVVAEKIPIYSSAGDAKAKIKATSSYAKGIYYIYTKYPNGVDGMLNISKDSSGKSAGGWINPAENVAKVQEAAVEKIYRVRKSWSDAKSQKGAYKSLDNAKECCQAAGEGYKVFDWDGKEVYSYTAPVITPPTEDKKEEVVIKKAVYELDYPEKHLIISQENASNDLDKEACTKAIVAIKKNNPDFDIEIAKAFFSLAGQYRIDPIRAISQSILETGWFKFAGSSVDITQHNYCGLGATGGGVSGATFETIQDGVRAQLQHLYAYGCTEELPDTEPLVDPRFKYVTRGIAPYWEQLAGRWAVPGFDGEDAETALKAGLTYGQKIDRIFNNLVETAITATDIDLYFASEEVEDTSNNEISTNNTEIDKAKVNSILGLLEKLIQMIISFFSKKE